MNDLRTAAQQALEALELGDEWHPSTLEAIAALRAALAQQAEQQPMHPELQKMWEDHIDKCFRAIPVPEQAEPVVRGAAYADALRWTIKACGAVQRHDGVWFGDDAAARLARVLSEGIATPQQAEAVEPVAWANIDSDRLRVDPATGNVSIGAQQAEPTPPDATAGLVDDLCLLHLGWKSGADGDLYRAATDRVIARAGKVRGLRKIEQLGGYDDE